MGSARDESQGMRLMHEASLQKVPRDTAIEDGKNEIQFAYAAAAVAVVRCGSAVQNEK